MIKFDFSVNNTMKEFENPETESTVYLGFANEPKTNIFSCKYDSSTYKSTTDILLKKRDDLLKVQKEKDYTVMIHLVEGWVNLDAATAAMALQQDRKELKSSDWSNLAIYISEIEQGSTPPPFLRSLYAFYHATRELVSHKQEFKELLNCKMQWIDDKTAKVVLRGKENNFTNESFVYISGATEETCNGQFEVLEHSPKELVIQLLPDFVWKTSFKDQQIKLLGEKKLKRRNLEVINSYHKILEDFLKLSGEKEIIKKPADFRTFMDLLDLHLLSFSITDHEKILDTVIGDYIKQDYLKAEKFEVDLPLKNVTGNQTHYRVPLLGLVEPQSDPLYKYFARNPMIYPGSTEEKRYPMTYVNRPTNNGKASEHVISIPPEEPYNLKGLSELLEKIEDRAREGKKEDKRPKDNPRDGVKENPYEYNDPWYDQRHSNNSIIDNPTKGSRLNLFDVLETLWHYGNPLERIKVEYATTSVFIPFWVKKEINEAKAKRIAIEEELKKLKGKKDQGSQKRIETLSGILKRAKISICKNEEHWDTFSYEKDLKKEKIEIQHVFLPFVEQIFNSTDQDPDQSGSLQAWSYNEKVELNLNPRHLQNYGKAPGESSPAVNVIREIAEEKANNLLDKAKKIDLRVFSYEFGFGIINLDIHLSEGCSIMDTQWLKHLISTTDCKELLKIIEPFRKELYDKDSVKDRENMILMPHKHYVCTTLSQFDYEGGSMTDCRSLGGGLQMMISDAEPLFHNLPNETHLKTNQTVVDEVTKRHFYCSASSMLNFDDVAFGWEHTEYHAFVSMLYNMVLAQRFILSENRKDIVEREWEYIKKKRDTHFGGWLKLKIKNLISNNQGSQTPEEKISEIREAIQHMTTSAWFNVVSSDRAFQEVFEELRNQMKVNEFYIEVQERCKDLDEFITKKQGSVQSRVFDIFTFVMSPLSLVVGFMGGTHLSRYFTRLNEDTHPFPFFDIDIQSGWIIFLIYGVLFSLLFFLVWVLYKYKSFKA